MRYLLFCMAPMFVSALQTAVISIGFGNRYWPELVEHVRGNKQAYCQQHGYHCLLTMHDLVTNCSRTLDSLHLVEPPAWGKIVAIRACLHRYDLVAWIDMDAVVVDNNVTIDAIADECPGKSILVSGNTCDPPPSTNTGFLVARRGEEGREVLSEVLSLSTRPEFRGHYWWEQNALNTIIQRKDSASELVCVLRASVQYFPGNSCMPPRPGNFIAHTAGSSGNKDRLSQLLTLG